MGAWGPGNFENDTALDWLGDGPTGATIARTVANVDLDDAESCERGLAAAELVATWNGRPADGLPPRASAARLRGSPKAALVVAAREAVRIIAARSELATLWRESAQHVAWVATQRDLLARLEQPMAAMPKPARQPRPRAVLRIEISDDGCTVGTTHDFRAAGLPPLPPPGAAPPLAALPRVDVGLGMDFTTDELDRIADWLAAAPHVAVGLSDAVRARGYRHEPARLEHFERARTLSLVLERAPDLHVLAGFDSLENLVVVCTRCVLTLPTSVRRLIVRESPPVDVREWAHLTALEELRLSSPATSALDALPSLRFLSISVGDLDTLARLRIETLQLSDVHADTNLAQLAPSATIQFLELHLHTRKQVEQIAKLPLRSLRFWIPDHVASDLVEPLRAHPTLERVMVSGFGWRRIRDALGEMGFAEGVPGDWPND